MRPWRIVLTGEGGSRDGRPDDVDVLTSQFAKHLEASGHEVKAVTFQSEGKQVDLKAQPAEARRRGASALLDTIPPVPPVPPILEKGPEKPPEGQPPAKPADDKPPVTTPGAGGPGPQRNRGSQTP